MNIYSNLLVASGRLPLCTWHRLLIYTSPRP